MPDSSITSSDLIESWPSGYLIFDRKFNLSEINETAKDFLAQLPNQPIGKHIGEVLAAYPTLPVLFQRSLLVQQTFSADVETKGRMLEVTYEPIYGENIERTYRGSIIFLHDVTQRKRSERTISELVVEKNRLLEQRRVQNEQLRFLSSQLVELQERERRHVAREIHDETGQALTVLLVGLRLLQSEVVDAEQLDQIEQLKQQVDEIMVQLHHLAVELHPTSLDKLGFEDSLRQLVYQFSKRTNLPVDLNIYDDLTSMMTSQIGLALYRIVQEALNNAVRHSEASRAEVLFQRRETELVLIVADNGIGFDQSAIDTNRIGLLSMRTRIEELGGRFQIESEPGDGTTVTVEYPIENMNMLNDGVM
ncbi:MAG: ATP-binding protein [Chloroflexota bacterium]